VTAPELSSQGGRARSHGARGSAGAHLNREMRSGAEEHGVTLEPTSAGRCGLKLQFAWQCVNASSVSYLDLELVYGVPGLQGADKHSFV
jgi:hypothetical protein